MDNRTKSNDQLFTEYLELVSLSQAPNPYYETKRILGHFRRYIGQFPPSTTLAVQFMTTYPHLKLNTRTRYIFILNGFFRWYCGEKLPLPTDSAKIVPQYVPEADIDRIIETLRQKKTHKKCLDRDILLIETIKYTGLRSAELANLIVGDLHLDREVPVLRVRQAKGAKDRIVALTDYLNDRLAAFTRGKSPKESVFRLATKSISLKISDWADKAGVPEIHAHSLRAYFATTLFERGGNPRAIQAMLGHESLETTQRYAAVVDKGLKETVNLLEKKPQAPQPYNPAAGVMAIRYGEPKKPEKRRKDEK